MIGRMQHRMTARSVTVRTAIEARLPRIMAGWLLLSAAASLLRIMSSPHPGAADLATLAPYVLLVAMPLASMLLALRWFRDGEAMVQPTLRLARVGSWRTVSLAQARAHPLYGPNGIMVSLMIGMLINIVVGSAEYLAALPALSGPVPAWLGLLHLLMTFNVVMMSSLYAVAFVAALRRVPLFPRLLVAIWAIDLASQLLTASILGTSPDLPAAVAQSLAGLLAGNVKKVLISVMIWMPYLLLSTRVNLTYRRRLPA